jgi:hypothetical protein
MSKCAITECEMVCRDGHLMCLAHWKLVPRDLQIRVMRAYHEYCHALRYRSGRTAAKRKEQYRTACKAAIAAAARSKAAA